MTTDVVAPRQDSLRARLLALDCRAFEAVASRHWPGADRFLPRLSRSANHGVLWFAAAGAIAATGSPRARRAAVRGVTSLALASVTINTVGKRSVRRARPLLDSVPLMRQLKRQPITTSFPSGHSASAAAFATGVALESRGWGAGVVPVAGAVALSRVYTGVHFPSDVLAGAALGVGAAFAVRGLAPARTRLPAPGRPRADAPALPGGEGLVLVAEAGDGADERTKALREALPLAEVITCERDAMATELEKAAAGARALGVCGGDGCVNVAAGVALRHGLPLAVLPGGDVNHFAYDIGVAEPRDLIRAVEEGGAVAVDVGRFASPDDAGATGGGAEGIFLNTFGIAAHPELVRTRARWAQRLGDRPTAVLAALRVRRSAREPMSAEFRGRRRPLWLLVAGNGTHRRHGLGPGRRLDLADGLLDLRLVHGGHRPRARLLTAALTGPAVHSPAQTSVRLRGLRVDGIAPGTVVAYDGEVTEVEGALVLDKLPEALTVYRPLPTTD
ncbi:bifunctional phosphatase PAP2/diacylglycerol kinase family protein [Streptomyces huasconensis]|uniref:bifunctional phosphatase PAP2/diacylglycerol kinase family protein n=1 Tax=Streptomyces huasconensis TaxID=1854574 RepID=UPI0033E95D3D